MKSVTNVDSEKLTITNCKTNSQAAVMARPMSIEATIEIANSMSYLLGKILLFLLIMIIFPLIWKSQTCAKRLISD
jgi:hypothetical protein